MATLRRHRKLLRRLRKRREAEAAVRRLAPKHEGEAAAEAAVDKRLPKRTMPPRRLPQHQMPPRPTARMRRPTTRPTATCRPGNSLPRVLRARLQVHPSGRARCIRAAWSAIRISTFKNHAGGPLQKHQHHTSQLARTSHRHPMALSVILTISDQPISTPSPGDVDLPAPRPGLQPTLVAELCRFSAPGAKSARTGRRAPDFF